MTWMIGAFLVLGNHHVDASHAMIFHLTIALFGTSPAKIEKLDPLCRGGFLQEEGPRPGTDGPMVSNGKGSNYPPNLSPVGSKNLPIVAHCSPSVVVGHGKKFWSLRLPRKSGQRSESAAWLRPQVQLISSCLP